MPKPRNGQGGLADDRVGDAQRAGDHERRRGTRQHVADDDPAWRRTERLGRGHEVHLAQVQELRPTSRAAVVQPANRWR